MLKTILISKHDHINPWTYFSRTINQRFRYIYLGLQLLHNHFPRLHHFVRFAGDDDSERQILRQAHLNLHICG